MRDERDSGAAPPTIRPPTKAHTPIHFTHPRSLLSAKAPAVTLKLKVPIHQRLSTPTYHAAPSRSSPVAAAKQNSSLQRPMFVSASRLDLSSTSSGGKGDASGRDAAWVSAALPSDRQSGDKNSAQQPQEARQHSDAEQRQFLSQQQQKLAEQQEQRQNLQQQQAQRTPQQKQQQPPVAARTAQAASDTPVVTTLAGCTSTPTATPAAAQLQQQQNQQRTPPHKGTRDQAQDNDCAEDDRMSDSSELPETPGPGQVQPQQQEQQQQQQRQQQNSMDSDGGDVQQEDQAEGRTEYTSESVYRTLMECLGLVTSDGLAEWSKAIPGLIDQCVRIGNIACTMSTSHAAVLLRYGELSEEIRKNQYVMDGLKQYKDDPDGEKQFMLMVIIYLSKEMTDKTDWLATLYLWLQHDRHQKFLPADGGLMLAYIARMTSPIAQKLDPTGRMFVMFAKWELGGTAGGSGAMKLLGLFQRLSRQFGKIVSEIGHKLRNSMWEEMMAEAEKFEVVAGTSKTEADLHELANNGFLSITMNDSSRGRQLLLTPEFKHLPNQLQAKKYCRTYMKRKIGPKASCTEDGNFARSEIDEWGGKLFNRVIRQLFFDTVNLSPFALWHVMLRNALGQMSSPELDRSSFLELFEDATIGRPLVEVLVLHGYKLVAGFLGQAGKPEMKSLGVKNDAPQYAPLISAVSNKTSESDCYYFQEHKDLANGRSLVPVELWTDPPLLIQQLMDEGPGVRNTSVVSDDEVWDEMNRESPVKASKTYKARKKSKRANLEDLY